MQIQSTEKCPICGAMLPESNHTDTITKLLELKQDGNLESTLLLAVSVVKQFNDKNPVWMKEQFNENLDEMTQLIKEYRQNEDKESKRGFKEIKAGQEKVFEKILDMFGTPQILGKLQEASIAKRLSALKIGQDSFSVERSNKALEDVECFVVHKGVPYGKILIESKRTKRWNSSYLSQLKDYMRREGTEFGILVSQSLPDDSLTTTDWKDGVLIVKPENVEPAYVFLREHLILKKDLEMEYEGKLAQLDVKETIMQELQNSILNGELEGLINKINKSANKIDSELMKTERYFEKTIKTMRRETRSIRDSSTEIMSKHVEKIRMQLMETIDSTPNYSEAKTTN